MCISIGLKYTDRKLLMFNQNSAIDNSESSKNSKIKISAITEAEKTRKYQAKFLQISDIAVGNFY